MALPRPRRLAHRQTLYLALPFTLGLLFYITVDFTRYLGSKVTSQLALPASKEPPQRSEAGKVRCAITHGERGL